MGGGWLQEGTRWELLDSGQGHENGWGLRKREKCGPDLAVPTRLSQVPFTSLTAPCCCVAWCNQSSK